jgi:hypothetical protein
MKLPMWEKLLGITFALLALMLVGLTLFIVLGVGAYVWDVHRIAVISIVGGAALGAFILRRRVRSPTPETDQQQTRLHPGITMHAIPIGGGIGLVFVLGYVVMFWFGAPGYRPIVLGAAALGGLFGALLIWFGRHARSNNGDTSMLHLDSTDPALAPTDGPAKRLDNNALPRTGLRSAAARS